jgi:hypothetical protein
MSWQPIDTAPRDGTVIDVWHPTYGRLVDQWWDSEDGWFSFHDDDGPTHWMHLPEPPK